MSPRHHINGNLPVKISKRTGKPVGQHGGARVGAGRKSGPNWKKQHPRVFAEKYEVLPLGHMLDILNEPNIKVSKNSSKEDKLRAREQKARKDDMAKAAAPYLHPRISSITFNSRIGETELRHSLDLSKLTDEELQIMERLVAKSQILAPDEDVELLEEGEADVGS